MKTLKLLTVILATSLNFPVFGQVKETVSKKISQYLQIQQQRIGFNGVILIAEKDKILYSKAIGKASFELDVPIILNSVFRIASVTKQFTAYLVAMAILDGKVRPTDSLKLYFPSLEEQKWRSITIQQLLTHSSGIPHNEGITDYWSIKSKLPLNREQALKEIFTMKLLFEPGKSFRYSSPGYYLLASILEIVYKMNYPDLLAKNITNQFNLTNTGVYNPQKLVPQLASGYHLLADSLLSAPYRDYSLMKGGGDMYSTAFDLIKWNNIILENKALLKMIFADYSGEKINQRDYYGYGWYIRNTVQHTRLAYYHGGGSFGTSAISVIYPHEDISIILLSNVSTLPVNEIWYDLERILFEESFTLPELNTRVLLDSNSLKKLTGQYIGKNKNHELMIFVNNSQLYGKLGANPPFELYATTSLMFYGTKVNAKFTFISNDEGETTGLIVEIRGEIMQFIKQ